MYEESDELVKWLLANGFTERVAGDKGNPIVMIFAAVVGPYVDIVHIRGEDRTEAARIPFDEHANMWRPRYAVWHYYGTLANVVDALMRLHPPGHPYAPTTSYEVIRKGDAGPLPLWVTEDEQRKTSMVRTPVNVLARMEGRACEGRFASL